MTSIEKLVSKLPKKQTKIGANSVVGLKTDLKSNEIMLITCIDKSVHKVSTENVKQVSITGYQENPKIEIILINKNKKLTGFVNLKANANILSIYLKQ